MDGPQAQASQAHTRAPRQALLGARSPLLVSMEAISHCRNAGNCRALAPCWISHVLEHDLESEKAGWQKEGLEADQGLDLSYGGGEPNMGRSSHPWRAPHAELRRSGAHHFSLDQARPHTYRAGATLASISSQPYRSHSRHGLL